MSKGGNRSKLHKDTSIKILVRIKSLYGEGYETDQFKGKLKNESNGTCFLGIEYSMFNNSPAFAYFNKFGTDTLN